MFEKKCILQKLTSFPCKIKQNINNSLLAVLELLLCKVVLRGFCVKFWLGDQLF
jgi:hypothetical protein